MIIQLSKSVTPSETEAVIRELGSFGFTGTAVRTQHGSYLIALGKGEIDIRRIGHLVGVTDVHRVSDAYKLVSRKWKVKETAIEIGDGVRIGGSGISMMAGPCSIESEQQVETIVDFLTSQGVRIMRGGAFKPRTSPYAFRGLGIDGLKMFHRLARARGIKVISEVVDVANISEMHDYVDIFQVGTRNTQNFSLLLELGKITKPVLLKRGMSGTLEELLQSAEYIFANGNEEIILCERGIRTFEKASRNTLDLNAVPILKEKSHLPVVVDPSHGIGIRRFVEPMALAAVAAGADGLLVEIHQSPEEALSDGDQSLNFEEATHLFDSVKKLSRVVENL